MATLNRGREHRAMGRSRQEGAKKRNPDILGQVAAHQKEKQLERLRKQKEMEQGRTQTEQENAVEKNRNAEIFERMNAELAQSLKQVQLNGQAKAEKLLETVSASGATEQEKSKAEIAHQHYKENVGRAVDNLLKRAGSMFGSAKENILGKIRNTRKAPGVIGDALKRRFAKSESLPSVEENIAKEQDSSVIGERFTAEEHDLSQDAGAEQFKMTEKRREEDLDEDLDRIIAENKSKRSVSNKSGMEKVEYPPDRYFAVPEPVASEFKGKGGSHEENEEDNDIGDIRTPSDKETKAHLDNVRGLIEEEKAPEAEKAQERMDQILAVLDEIEYRKAKGLPVSEEKERKLKDEYTQLADEFQGQVRTYTPDAELFESQHPDYNLEIDKKLKERKEPTPERKTKTKERQIKELTPKDKLKEVDADIARVSREVAKIKAIDPEATGSVLDGYMAELAQLRDRKAELQFEADQFELWQQRDALQKLLGKEEGKKKGRDEEKIWELQKQIIELDKKISGRELERSAANLNNARAEYVNLQAQYKEQETEELLEQMNEAKAEYDKILKETAQKEYEEEKRRISASGAKTPEEIEEAMKKFAAAEIVKKYIIDEHARLLDAGIELRSEEDKKLWERIYDKTWGKIPKAMKWAAAAAIITGATAATVAGGAAGLAGFAGLTALRMVPAGLAAMGIGWGIEKGGSRYIAGKKEKETAEIKSRVEQQGNAIAEQFDNWQKEYGDVLAKEAKRNKIKNITKWTAATATGVGVGMNIGGFFSPDSPGVVGGGSAVEGSHESAVSGGSVIDTQEGAIGGGSAVNSQEGPIAGGAATESNQEGAIAGGAAVELEPQLHEYIIEKGEGPWHIAEKWFADQGIDNPSDKQIMDMLNKNGIFENGMEERYGEIGDKVFIDSEGNMTLPEDTLEDVYEVKHGTKEYYDSEGNLQRIEPGEVSDTEVEAKAEPSVDVDTAAGEEVKYGITEKMDVRPPEHIPLGQEDYIYNPEDTASASDTEHSADSLEEAAKERVQETLKAGKEVKISEYNTWQNSDMAKLSEAEYLLKGPKYDAYIGFDYDASDKPVKFEWNPKFVGHGFFQEWQPQSGAVKLLDGLNAKTESLLRDIDVRLNAYNNFIYAQHMTYQPDLLKPEMKVLTGELVELLKKAEKLSPSSIVEYKIPGEIYEALKS